MAKKTKNKQKHADKPKSPTGKVMQVTAPKAIMDKVDQMVKMAGEHDRGEPHLELCPRCGSTDIGIRKIDIPGFFPEVQVCNKCGFRSESAVEVEPIEYFEEVGEGEEDMSGRLAEIEKRVQSGQYTVEQGARKKAKEMAKQAKKAAGKKLASQSKSQKQSARQKPKPRPSKKPKKKR